MKIKATTLPFEVAQFLETNTSRIKDIFKSSKNKMHTSNEQGSENVSTLESMREFKQQLVEVFQKCGQDWTKEIDRIWAFGPSRVGPNILLNHIPEYCDSVNFRSVFTRLEKKKAAEAEAEVTIEEVHGDHDDTKSQESENIVSFEEKLRLLRELDHGLVSGFQLATAAGPLCEEPMFGVCFAIEDIQVFKRDVGAVDRSGPLSGQVISTMKDTCRQAFQVKSMRLVEALYQCEVQVSAEALGKVYAVLGKRRARILKEGMKESTEIFSIHAMLPVVESFGFPEQLLKQTSGSASAQLLFENDWQVMEQDPYYMPTTEEELEDNGTNIASLGTNISRKYMDQVRRRKGLAVEEKIVEHAEKQRTLKKNK